MPSTTTKKPNDGPCAACNKEGAILRCAPCRDAGVDVFFCNRDCQVKLWKIHKAVCKKTCNGDLKKVDSIAKKEVKQDGKEGFQLLLERNIIICANCMKRDADIGFKLSFCSKCKKSYYCSRECQVEDWPKHKRLCKQNCEISKSLERSFDSRGMNVCDLFQKWVATTRMTCMIDAVYYALKKKGIEQQPPVKAVLVEVEFNSNAQTFVVVEAPRAVTIDDLSQGHKENIRKALKSNKENVDGGIDQSYTQFVIASTKELGKRYEGTLPIEITKRILDKMSAAHTDMCRILRGCAHARLRSNLFPGWKSIRRNNLQKQMEQMKLGQSYTAFVQNALQFVSNKSLQNTHRIIVNMKIGKEIGQISQLIEYKVVPIVDFKKYKEEVEKFVTHVKDIESRPPQCTENAIETLFIDTDMCFAFDYTAFCEVNVIQNKTVKQCKRATDKHFRKLQQSVKGIPSNLLEKVSL